MFYATFPKVLNFGWLGIEPVFVKISLQPKCSLHVHMVLGRWYLYIPPVLSSSSAVGIIVAQGNVLSTDSEFKHNSVITME